MTARGDIDNPHGRWPEAVMEGADREGPAYSPGGDRGHAHPARPATGVGGRRHEVETRTIREPLHASGPKDGSSRNRGGGGWTCPG